METIMNKKLLVGLSFIIHHLATQWRRLATQPPQRETSHLSAGKVLPFSEFAATFLRRR